MHIQSPIVWIGLSWIGAALFLAPAIAGGKEAAGQGFLVDLLFWVTLLIVAGALIGDWLGIMGCIERAGSGSAIRAFPTSSSAASGRSASSSGLPSGVFW